VSPDQTARQANQPFIMRPSVGQTGKVIGVGLLAGGGYVALRLIRGWQDTSARALLLGLMALILGPVLLGYLFFFARARIQIDGARILKVSAFGGRRSYPLEAVGGVAFRVLHQPLSRAPDPTLGVVYGRDGRGLFTFSAKMWDPADVERLAEILGGRDSGSQPTVSRHEFEREFPGAFNVWERHPHALGVLLAIILLVGLVVFVSRDG
jgi:hypothetical protein